MSTIVEMGQRQSHPQAKVGEPPTTTTTTTTVTAVGVAVLLATRLGPSTLLIAHSLSTPIHLGGLAIQLHLHLSTSHYIPLYFSSFNFNFNYPTTGMFNLTAPIPRPFVPLCSSSIHTPLCPPLHVWKKMITTFYVPIHHSLLTTLFCTVCTVTYHAKATCPMLMAVEAMC